MSVKDLTLILVIYVILPRIKKHQRIRNDKTIFDTSLCMKSPPHTRHYFRYEWIFYKALLNDFFSRKILRSLKKIFIKGKFPITFVYYRKTFLLLSSFKSLSFIILMEIFNPNSWKEVKFVQFTCCVLFSYLSKFYTKSNQLCCFALKQTTFRWIMRFKIVYSIYG